MEAGSQLPTQETQATLLLCAPLVAAKSKEFSPLSTGEFNDLETELQKIGAAITDLLEPNRSEGLLNQLAVRFEADRLRGLLNRGFALSLALEKWMNGGIWVVSREDEASPARIKDRLKQYAPPILYGCGDRSWIESGGVAIVGSRDIDQAATEFTQRLGEACARDQLTVISGGAR